MELTVAELIRAEAKAETEVLVTRSALRTVLVTRFGALPPEIEEALSSASVEVMEIWLRRAANASSLEEARITS